ncbi:MAG: insulinase family protein [Candidatus Azobacteroides sp.]|nr:insulinase family protein [Candidatus Azobacteroides sp.]
MKNRLFFLMLFVSVVCIAKGQNEQIKFTEYDLANGLHVILYPKDATPNVLVSMAYHVGSKNEDPNRTGFAHLFEHLLFEGSENIGRGEFDSLIQAAGGYDNAYTTQDQTYYYENVLSNELELVLWIESERLYHAKIDSIGVKTQKGVVIEEKKQRIDNQPYASFPIELSKRAFRVHPYRWQPIGDAQQVQEATFDDINNFYKTYYVPNNVVLVVAGDFDETQTKMWIDKYFGTIPRGERPFNRPDIVEPPQTVEVRDTVYDKIQLPALFMAYHGPAMGTKDAYAVNIIAQILSGGKSSRLKTNLDDKGLTLQSAVFFQETEDPGLIYLLGVANMGKDLQEIEKALNVEIDRMANELVSEEEFQMAIAAKEYETADRLQTLSGVSESLARNYLYFKDTNRINKELSYYEEITREDLQNAARKYFRPESRVVLYYLPE